MEVKLAIIIMVGKDRKSRKEGWGSITPDGGASCASRYKVL
jgi:hypothetical protein